MSTRRNFLKNSVLFGTAAMSSVSFATDTQQPAEIPASKDTYKVSMSHILAKTVSPRKIVIPDVDGFKVLKGDYHIHTLFSDGEVMPIDRVKDAVGNGLDAIAITDHIEYRPNFSKNGRWPLKETQANNFNLWYDVAIREAEKHGLILIRATEITKKTMPPGHFNALFTTDNNSIAGAVDNFHDMLSTAAAQGAFLLWNHPGWEAPQRGGIEPGDPLHFTEAHEELYKQGLLHGIEIFNGSQHYPIVHNWCNDRNLAMFANSDIHKHESEVYGVQNPLRPVTLAFALEKTVASLREAFFAKRIIAWAANILWGRDTYLTTLFKSSVKIKIITPGILELTNQSSLPIFVSTGGPVVELFMNIKRQIQHTIGIDKITVANWMINMNQPLEITI